MALNLLAFDTSTETLSVALQWAQSGALCQAVHESAGGAQASAGLIPAAAALLARAELDWTGLDAIVFGRGPGSFTGLRTACAVAQGLGFGAGRPVLPVDTLLAVAEDARASAGVHQVVAVLDARMGEVYAATYQWSATQGWQQLSAVQLLQPAQVVVPPGYTVAGNYAGAAAPGGELHAAAQVAARPTAAALLRLAAQLFAAGHAVAAEAAWPLYVRDKVAQTVEERAAARAAAA